MNYVYVPAELACPSSIWQLTRGVCWPVSEVCIERYLLKIRFWDTTRTDDVAECSKCGHERGYAQLTRDTWRPESVLASTCSPKTPPRGGRGFGLRDLPGPAPKN